jgi:hypothetical protein
MSTLIKKSRTKVGSNASEREKRYIKENLNFFIEKERKCSRSAWESFFLLKMTMIQN